MVNSIKHNQTLGLMPIFRTVKKGDREKYKLDIRKERPIYNGKGKVIDIEKIRVVCFEPLADDDQTVLFAILALCTDEQRGLILGHTPETVQGVSLRKELFKTKTKQKPKETDSDGIMIHVSERELIKMCGKKDGGSSYDHLRENLFRLSSMFLHVENNREAYSSRLLAFYDDKVEGKISIGINPYSASAILGGQYSYISLKEHVGIKYAPAKILHGWLSSWMPQGAKRRIGAPALCAHVYPNYEGVSEDSQRTYRSYTKKAAMALQEAGWKVSLEGRGDEAMYTIQRPRRKA